MTTIVTDDIFMNSMLNGTYSESNEYYSDFINFIQNDVFNVRLICDFPSVEELEFAVEKNPYWELLLDKNDIIEYYPKLLDDVYIDTFYHNLDEENIFLISLPYEDCLSLSSTRGYIYISSQDISASWRRLKYIRDNSFLKVTNDPNFPISSKFDTWDKLDLYILPLTSIVIFDKYIFADKSNQKLEDNLFKLLDKLCINSLLKPLNVTIISQFDSDADINNKYNLTMSYLTRKGHLNVKLNIIKFDKDKNPSNSDGLHFRVLLTNYLRIKSDDSFNFFKTNGKINNDADLHISFQLSQNLKCFYNKELDHLKSYVSKIKNLDPSISLAYKIYCIPDKDNYLFK